MDAENLKTILDQSIGSYGTRTAVRVLRQGPDSQGPSYEPITYAELGRMRNAVAAGLAGLGVGKGDRVGILTDGGFEPLLVFLACDLLAVCTVPLCNKLPEEILTHNINHSGISFLVVDGKSLVQVDAVAASLEQPPKLILTDGSREDATPWDQVAGCEAAPPDVEVSPSDESKVIYTSGSSGLPKGVVQTHANIVANLRQVWDVVVESDNFRFFKSAPDYHSMGILNIYYPLAKGWELDLARSPDRVLTDIRVSEPEGFLTVPLVLDKVYGNVRKEIDAGGIKGRLVERAVGARQRIARGEGSLGDRLVSATIGGKIVAKIKEQLSKRVGGNLELLIVGSAKADPEALDFFQDVLGIRTLEGYGTTECAPLIATNHLKGRKTGTVGRPLFEVRLVDEQGEVLASADPASGTCRPGPGAGELWVSGANVMKEYLNDPERNAEVLVEKDGRRWYRTGDLFSMDEEGFLTFQGRVGRQFKLANGEFINPELLERVFSRAALVEHVLVSGDQTRSQPVVLATVDLEEAGKIEGVSGDEESIRSHPEVAERIRSQLLHESDLARLPAHERPVNVVVLPAALSEEDGTLTRGLKKVVPKAVEERHAGTIAEALSSA